MMAQRFLLADLQKAQASSHDCLHALQVCSVHVAQHAMLGVSEGM